MYTICISMLLSLSLTACSSDRKVSEETNTATVTKTRKVVINGDYSIDIPDHMKERKGLNDDASLQFCNIFKGMYVIVIDESKDTFIDTFKGIDEYDTTRSVAQNYRDVQLQLMTEHYSNVEQSTSKSLRIDGLDAEMLTMDARVDGTDISYLLTFIEGTDNVYCIMAWTLKNKKEKHIGAFSEMAKTFRLVDEPVVH